MIEYSVEVHGSGTEFQTLPQNIHQARLTYDKLRAAFPKATHQVYVYAHTRATKMHMQFLPEEK